MNAPFSAAFYLMHRLHTVGALTFNCGSRCDERHGSTYDGLCLAYNERAFEDRIAQQRAEWRRQRQDEALQVAHDEKMVAAYAERFGLGYHPDTRASEYDPPLTGQEHAEYEAIHDRVGTDRAADIGLRVWTKLGWIENPDDFPPRCTAAEGVMPCDRSPCECVAMVGGAS